VAEQRIWAIHKTVDGLDQFLDEAPQIAPGRFVVTAVATWEFHGANLDVAWYQRLPRMEQ
jgi:hypothetical protein